MLIDCGSLRRRGEGGPATTAVIFLITLEQFCATPGAKVTTIVKLMIIFAGESAFRACLAQHVILLSRELVSPLCVGQVDLIHATNMEALAQTFKPWRLFNAGRKAINVPALVK